MGGYGGLSSAKLLQDVLRATAVGIRIGSNNLFGREPLFC
jgi:hypothetical protein